MTISFMMFNIEDEQGKRLCPVCGFSEYFTVDIYADNEEERGGKIGSGICACCSFEPGFDDCIHASSSAKETVLASIIDRRRKWIKGGGIWFSDRPEWPRPEDWNVDRQLEKLFALCPEVEE